MMKKITIILVSLIVLAGLVIPNAVFGAEISNPVVNLTGSDTVQIGKEATAIIKVSNGDGISGIKGKVVCSENMEIKSIKPLNNYTSLDLGEQSDFAFVLLNLSSPQEAEVLEITYIAKSEGEGTITVNELEVSNKDDISVDNINPVEKKVQVKKSSTDQTTTAKPEDNGENKYSGESSNKETGASGKIPQTGVFEFTAIGIIVSGIVAVVLYFKNKKYKGI